MYSEKSLNHLFFPFSLFTPSLNYATNANLNNFSPKYLENWMLELQIRHESTSSCCSLDTRNNKSKCKLSILHDLYNSCNMYHSCFEVCIFHYPTLPSVKTIEQIVITLLHIATMTIISNRCFHQTTYDVLSESCISRTVGLLWKIDNDVM